MNQFKIAPFDGSVTVFFSDSVIASTTSAKCYASMTGQTCFIFHSKTSTSSSDSDGHDSYSARLGRCTILWGISGWERCPRLYVVLPGY